MELCQYTRYTWFSTSRPLIVLLLLPHRSTNTSTDDTGQFFTAHGVEHTNPRRDQERQGHADHDEKPELNGDILLLASRPAPVGDLPLRLHALVLATVFNGRRASASVAVKTLSVASRALALVQQLALTVTAAAMRLLLTCRLAVEAARKDTADGGRVVCLAADDDWEVLKIGYGWCRRGGRLGAERKERFWVLAAGCCSGRHGVCTPGVCCSLGVFRGGRHGDNGGREAICFCLLGDFGV